MFYKKYANSEKTGWLGWIETSTGRAIAFVKLTGEIVWDW